MNGQYVGESETRMRCAGPEGVPEGVQPERDLVRAAGLERLRVLVRVAVREVQEPTGDEQ